MANRYSAPFSVDLTGRAAIVTGAGTDIGRAIALALAAAGAAVGVNDLNPDKCDQVVDAITASGGRAVALQGDVANRFQAAAMIESARDAFGGISILVNAAGVFKTGAMAKLDEWDWRRVIDVNLTGTFFCTQLMGRVLADEGGGVIVNLASDDTLPEGISYAASKAGVIGLTRQSARELAPAGIRVNAVCVPPMDDDDPRAEEAARVILFLCSDAASAINGQAIPVSVS